MPVLTVVRRTVVVNDSAGVGLRCPDLGAPPSGGGRVQLGERQRRRRDEARELLATLRRFAARRDQPHLAPVDKAADAPGRGVALSAAAEQDVVVVAPELVAEEIERQRVDA